jgi:hypothetical protein
MCRINGVAGSSSSSSSSNIEGKSMSKLSLGVITLNRPQRALLYAFVLAARHRLGLIPLSQANSKSATANQSNASGSLTTPRAPAPAASGGGGSGGSSSSSLNGFVRHPLLQQPGDEVLFIQSIDQIQGEERDVILFSTLLAPKTATKEVAVEASKEINDSDDRDQEGDDDDDDDDLLDKLEESGETSEEEDDDDDEASDEDDFDDASSRSNKEKDGKMNSASVGASGRRLAVPSSAAKAKKSKKKTLSASHQRPRSRSRSRSPPQQPSGGTRSLGLSYSTLAHAHGERLLNVGLTRAVIQ